MGGGTGGLAVPFAALGHNVTVVDPSPDALAAAQRRAAEAGARLTAVQGEAASLDSVAGPKSADLVICHNVLEYVDSPADAMTAIAAVLRPSATVSVLAADTVAAVLHRALAGRFTEARQLLEDATAVSGPPRRFTLPELTALIEAAGLRAGESHGLRIFSGLVPGALLDADAGAAPRRCVRSRRPRRPPRRCGTSPRNCTCSATADAMNTEGRAHPDDTGCPILHVDMDAFYASVEVRERPELAAGPSSWAGPAAAAWCSRPRTRPGRSACGRRCRWARAQRLCPQAVFVPPGTGCTPPCPRRSWRSSARSRPTWSRSPSMRPSSTSPARGAVSGRPP